MAISNIFGITTGMFLMGYGLVEIPRLLLRKADAAYMLQRYAHILGSTCLNLIRRCKLIHRWRCDTVYVPLTFHESVLRPTGIYTYRTTPYNSRWNIQALLSASVLFA
eukprot:9404422-Pyramimonas_sp.AAC.1